MTFLVICITTQENPGFLSILTETISMWLEPTLDNSPSALAWRRSLVRPLTADLRQGWRRCSLYFRAAAADCVCTLISGLQLGQIYRSTVGRWDRTPLASSVPRCHYARVRYSEILIPMPLHFAITITQSSPGLHGSWFMPSCYLHYQ